MENVLTEQLGISSVRGAIEAAWDFFLKSQAEDGHWCGELEGDTILESEYILTMHFLGRAGEPKIQKAANYIRSKALPEGGWAVYPGGPPDVSASAKAYFVLKLMGDDPNSEHMRKAREVILSLGGLDATNSFTRIYLAVFGQYPWDRCPAVPPEVILLPTWFPINIYAISSWSRCIVVPLSIIWAQKPFCPVPDQAAISELRIDSRPSYPGTGFWRRFFLVADGCLKFVEGRRLKPFRRWALRRSFQWMVEHFKESDGLGAIFPPIINSILALKCLGYETEDSLTQSQIQALERLEIEEGDTLRVAPCYSPVWDTALAINALVESGMDAQHPSLLEAVRWIQDREVRTAGDWKVRNPAGPAGGWYFEYANEFYPDVDDTFQVLVSLSKVRFHDPEEEAGKRDALERALNWTLSMQNRDGGWASFDRGCDREFLTQVPFADHNAMIDPSTADITGRGLEALTALGYQAEHPALGKALAYLWKNQEPDGSWYGRWGCNYIYGTWLALRALKAAGEDMGKDRIQRAHAWLTGIQNTDGGWGELPSSYDSPEEKGRGPSTPSQTAWALMGLMDCGDYTSTSVQKGIEYLLEQQCEDGSWRDEFWTGTGFPRVFYLKYHLYGSYFSLLALGQFERREG